MRRSEFLRGVVSTAAVLALPGDIASGTVRRIGAGTVRECQAALDRLYEVDERRGGATVYALAAEMVEQLKVSLARASYGPAVGRGLREVAAATAEHAGWVAFDSGRREDSRRWWLEALHLAELAEASHLRVTAFASMALQACNTPNSWDGREAVELMDAARRAAGRTASPRLLSLLAARQALGHARSGDGTESARWLAESDRLLAKGAADGDEPAWLTFWGQADLACHRARAAICLGDFKQAQAAAQFALRECDGERYPRNQVIYASVLGSALVRDGHLDEAMSAMAPVVARVNSFGSRRILTETHTTLRMLDRQKGYQPVASFTNWARQIIPAA